MTPEQATRIAHLEPDSLWRIEDGSWFAVRRSEGGTWVEVIGPRPTALLAMDFLPEQAVIIVPPEPRPALAEMLRVLREGHARGQA